MNYKLLTATIAAAMLLAAAPARSEGSDDSPFSLKFSAGIEYDSNVAVLELDTSAGEGDVAALVDFGVGFDKKLTEGLKLKLGYDFSQSLHDEFDTFDLRIHRGSGELSYDFGRTDAGVGFQYADAALDGDDFLVLQRTAPYLSHLFGDKLFLRLEFARAEKEFETNPGRDATADSWSVDAFVFLDGVKHYVILGYKDLDEDAIDDQFDYTGSKVKAQLMRRLGQKQVVKLKTGLQYERREYATPLIPLGAPREDDRYGFELELEWPMAGKGFVRTGYAYNDNRSDLAGVDFDEHVVSIELGGRF